MRTYPDISEPPRNVVANRITVSAVDFDWFTELDTGCATTSTYQLSGPAAESAKKEQVVRKNSAFVVENQPIGGHRVPNSPSASCVWISDNHCRVYQLPWRHGLNRLRG